MGRALIADGESPTSGAQSSSLPVAAVGDRAGTRNYDDARPVVERGFECDLHIAYHVNGHGKNLSKELADESSQLRARGTRTAHAHACNLLRRDAGGSARLLHRLTQRLARLRLANAHNVARSRSGRRQKGGIIPDGARGLCSSAVNAEIVGHKLFLT